MPQLKYQVSGRNQIWDQNSLTAKPVMFSRVCGIFKTRSIKTTNGVATFFPCHSAK